MVDRAARDRVAALIEEFLDDRLTAFEFDDQMMAVETTDETVRAIVGTCWFFYDDCTDHKVVLSKPERDLIQRLLLILRSYGELLQVQAATQWGWDNLLAALCCAAFVIVGILTGWGIHLLLMAIPLGIVVSRSFAPRETSRSSEI